MVYRGLWPGIDLVHETTSKGVKYHFEVHPGADPGRIRMAYRGAAGAVVDEAGQLVLSTAAGELLDDRPYAYQSVAGHRWRSPAPLPLPPRGRRTSRLGFQSAPTTVLPCSSTRWSSPATVGDGAVDSGQCRRQSDRAAWSTSRARPKRWNVVRHHASWRGSTPAGTALPRMYYLAGHWIDNIPGHRRGRQRQQTTWGPTRRRPTADRFNGSTPSCGNGVRVP